MDEEFIECGFEAFVKAYLPFVPTKEDIADCLARLREATTPDGDPMLRTGNFGTEEKPDLPEYLGDFHDTVHPIEAQLFSRLDGFADVLAESQISGRQYRYQFFDCHNHQILSDVEGSTNKIDACFPPVGCVLPKSGESTDDTDRLHTSIIPVACEWKVAKDPLDRRKNNLQVVSANVQIMNADASRMFSFGMTIEEDELRLWYFSRSHSAVSKAVDYVKNPAFLVQAFLSFMFATREEMGYDPTVTFHHDNNNYTYSIPPATPDETTRFFRTRKILSEYRSNNVTGRMARIWLVDEVTSNAKDAEAVAGKPQYVLKDVWLENSAQTEQQIQKAIFKSIDAFLASSSPVKEAMQGMLGQHRRLIDKGAYKNFFLTIAKDYEGQKSKPLAGGHKKHQGLFATQGLFGTMSGQVNATTPGQTRSTCSTPRDIHEPPVVPVPQLPRAYAQKKQYRVIFKEECVPVGELNKLADVIDVLKQTLIPLQLLLGAGWVHRDISSGNILAFKQRNGNWKVKVSDLEYAKKFPRDPKSKGPSGDPKTGTPFFMAHEILDGSYIYRSFFDPDNPPASFKDSERKEPVIHNFQHDLESIYWLLFWTLVDRIPHEPSHRYSCQVFLNVVLMTKKRSDAFLTSIWEDLEKSLKPSVVFFAEHLNILRSFLYAFCQKRKQENKLNDPLSYINTYGRFSQFFEDVAAGRSKWANEELSSRHEIAKLYPALKEIKSGEGLGTSSAPRQGKRLRGSLLARPRSPDSYVPSEGSEAQSDDSTSSLSEAPEKPRIGRRVE